MTNQIQITIDSKCNFDQINDVNKFKNNNDSNYLKLSDRLCKGLYNFYWFGILITIYTTIVFGILGLIQVSENKLQDICPNSNIWSLVLSWIIMTLITLYFFVKTNPDQSLGLIICSIIQVSVYVILGSNELWNLTTECGKLHNKTLFLALNLIVYVNILIVASLIILALVLGLVCIWCLLYNDNNLDKNNIGISMTSSGELNKVDQKIELSDSKEDDDSIDL